MRSKNDIEGRPGRIIAIAAAAVFAAAGLCATGASAATSAHHKHHHKSHLYRHGGHFRGSHLGYLPYGASGRGPGYKELVGDPDSGVGFYPLPERYRIGAWRYHMRQAAVPPWIRNGVLYAMTMDAYRYNYAWADPVNAWRYGVYDPFAGVGTPYSGGFYGPAAGDEEEPAFPFGRPYNHW